MMGKLFTAWWRAGEQDGNVEHEVGDGVDVGDGLAHPAAQGQRQLHSAGEAEIHQPENRSPNPLKE